VRARDDLVRRPVASHRIHRDGEHDYSTSIAWRPAYQPQFPHTMWGCLAALQRGQTLREGSLRVHADARRLRLFDFDVFFFGTAIAAGS